MESAREKTGVIEKPIGVASETTDQRVARSKKFSLLLSFVLLCLLPIFIGVVYYSFVASDRYATGASFVVRGLGDKGSTDFVGSITGLPSYSSTTSDSYVIRRYLESPDLIREIDDKLKLRDHYSDQSHDIISRYDSDEPIEEFFEYWEWRIHTSYDSTTGIVSFEVEAFDPQTALVLANEILASTDRLVNMLSEQAREDSVKVAANEVTLAEKRMSDAQVALLNFRALNGEIDPAMNAGLDARLISSLEVQLVDTEARIITLSASVDKGGPILRQLELKAKTLRQQISEKRSAIGSDAAVADGTATAAILAKFEGLQLEQSFSQKQYASAMTSLEAARMSASRQQRYLAVFSHPFLPEDAIYPYRVKNTILLALAALAFWAIGTLFVFAIRDHLD